MANITANISAQTVLSVSNIATLPAGKYGAASNTINLLAVDPLDVIFEIEITPGVVSGNKQALIFVKTSVDGSIFSTGPESISDVSTDEPNLCLLGALPLNTSSQTQRGHFSVAAALGWVPAGLRLVVKNDSGAAFTAALADYVTVAGVSA